MKWVSIWRMVVEALRYKPLHFSDGEDWLDWDEDGTEADDSCQPETIKEEKMARAAKVKTQYIAIELETAATQKESKLVLREALEPLGKVKRLMVDTADATKKK